jgi:multiple sugar transport system permease protein
VPIISQIGSKHWKVRLVYAGLFALLLGGSVSMLFPLLLMLSGSVKSAADFNNISVYPQYWFDNQALFQKYAESKYLGNIDLVEQHWGARLGSLQKIVPPAERSEYLPEFLEWRKTCRWFWLGHSAVGQFLPINSRLFRTAMQDKFHGDLQAFRVEMQLPIKSWNDVRPPPPNPFRFLNTDNPLVRAFNEFAQTRPVEDRAIVNLDGKFTKSFLIPKYTSDIVEYNRKHNTAFKSYDDVFLSRRAPPESGTSRNDWEKFVRTQLPLEYMRLDGKAEPAYREFISARYMEITAYNTKFKTSLSSFADMPLPTSAPDTRLAQVDWSQFIADTKYCPADWIEIFGPRQSFEEFVAAKRSVAVEKLTPLRLPTYQADYQDAMAQSSSLRSEFTTRNYQHVFEYVLMHGDGMWNTLIYCLLAIATSLTINPLAAYSLSRFKPPSTYTVLLFCMATMAFPGEVTMIPGFLLKRNFPLWGLAGGCAAFLLTWIIAGLVKKGLPDTLRALIALGFAIVAGAWAVPALFGDTSVSLLNTFAVLVLPGMANGFSIFLLKGFFDSLPQELYEAADIDGASEWTKFWTFTMALSKPILAVIALDAFNGAYSAFMMALIIIPDQKMWTLMVWLYQLHSQVHAAVVFASITITAIPTLLIFVFCQNLIMRGIVVPTEK